MAEELGKLLQEFRAGKISRREFIRQAILVSGSLAAANRMIEALLPAPAMAAQVPANDPELSHIT